MASNRKKTKYGSTQIALPHIEHSTCVTEKVKVPTRRQALFLTIETNLLHDRTLEELSFSALSPDDRAMFQMLLYLTYCCKGALLQVTLENPDFAELSPAIREDFAHGRLYCFVLDMDTENICQSATDSASSQRPPEYYEDNDNLFDYQLSGLTESIDLGVFRHPEDFESQSDHAEVIDEAFNAFMRLQLVRRKACSLNNAMLMMRDSKDELKSIFDWLDIHNDSLNANKLDKKTVKDLQGSMYTPACHSGRQAVVLPDTITELNLNSLDRSIGKITDTSSKGKDKDLFRSIMSKLTASQWLDQNVMKRAYKANVPKDIDFVKKLTSFTRQLGQSTGHDGIDIDGLLVFNYSLDKLIDREIPDLFVRSLIHRHVSVSKTHVDSVLRDIKSRRRTRKVTSMLLRGNCYCHSQNTAHSGPCNGNCQTAHSCFYNLSEVHPFILSKNDHSHYFAHLYPHLARLERLSKEMKQVYRSCIQFESIANMVFMILVCQRSSEQDSIYRGLSEVINDYMHVSRMSLGYHFPDIHKKLCVKDRGTADPIKAYDRSLVRYLFCDDLGTDDGLKVGRLFQASTTFNYIITNTAPRYTIERIMLLNITGPGEGKSYANNVLSCQFRRVTGCIEKLTSFTPQAFKYKQNRNTCVVMIDDAHVTHEKNTKALDRESNVIPNTFKNLLDTSILESDVVTKDVASGAVSTVKFQAVHNCGFVWNTNTMGFVSDAWADRCLIMESEFPERVNPRTCSTKQLQDTVEKHNMDRIAEVCLYRQNMIQSATMIAESEIMQFGERFDKARDSCLEALYASHIVCTGAVGRRISFCINQLVYAEAMKLACHFVFDIWLPPWTIIPRVEDHPRHSDYMKQLNSNRLLALNELSFGQICIETNAVYKLCAAACLPDICPRVIDMQARFACKVLGYVLTQIHEQRLRITLKDNNLCISGVDCMFFPETAIRGGSDNAHEMLMLCAACKVPIRECNKNSKRNHKLCTYKLANTHMASHMRRGQTSYQKKVASLTVPLENVYDMLALYAPQSHSGFWDQLTLAILDAYKADSFEGVNAFGQYDEGSDDRESALRLSFTLDFDDDPVRSLILESTAGVEPLNELTFNKSVLGGETFNCSAPLYYGGILVKELGSDAPDGARDIKHIRESKLGTRATFHGPRLSVYSSEYAGVPVKNMSSFCTTRTIYHHDKILLRANNNSRKTLFKLERDWEWKDAADVFNRVHGAETFTVDTLKRNYAGTMLVSNTEEALQMLVETMSEAGGRDALGLRIGTRRASQEAPSTSRDNAQTRSDVSNNRKRSYECKKNKTKLYNKKNKT